VRRLGAQDWPLLRELRLAALADAPHAFASTHEREHGRTEAQWRARIDGVAWFVAEVDGAPVGLAAGSPDDAGGVGLVSMWVDPAHRGRRLAERLIRAVQDWAGGLGAREVSLWVADGNTTAASVYARAGFVPTGERQPLPSHPEIGEERWVLALSR
jgi:RimJ/RimL family protein N-acetyltransferase